MDPPRKEESVLGEILKELGVESNYTRPPTTPISKDQVKRWMECTDIEALGALYALLDERRHFDRIQPPLTFEEYFFFVKGYLQRCFLEDPQGDWSNSRYEAGWDSVGWFAWLHRDHHVPRWAVKDMKEWLEQLYKNGDEALRTCLVNAALEHIFEQPALREYFADWKNDPTLVVAYSQALEWTLGGGETPLGKPPGWKPSKRQTKSRQRTRRK